MSELRLGESLGSLLRQVPPDDGEHLLCGRGTVQPAVRPGNSARVVVVKTHPLALSRHNILGCNSAPCFCGSGERSLARPCSLAPHCSPLVGAWKRWISPLRVHLA